MPIFSVSSMGVCSLDKEVAWYGIVAW